MLLNIIYLAALFIAGTAIGSFISVLVYRLHHRETGIFKGRSMCVECRTPLKAQDLIPLLSYLTLRGKCRYCSKEISFMYPAIEIITGFLFAAMFLKFPFVDEFLNFNGATLLNYAIFAFYSFILIFTFFFDMHYHHVADEILLPAILAGLVFTLVPGSPHIIDALLGMLIAIAFFGAQFVLSRGRWIGAGDIRIGAFMGVILGWKLVIVALVLSYLVGSVASIFIALKKHRFYGVKIPFAPALVTGTFLTIFFGEKIINWYLHTLDASGSILSWWW